MKLKLDRTWYKFKEGAGGKRPPFLKFEDRVWWGMNFGPVPACSRMDSRGLRTSLSSWNQYSVNTRRQGPPILDRFRGELKRYAILFPIGLTYYRMIRGNTSFSLWNQYSTGLGIDSRRGLEGKDHLLWNSGAESGEVWILDMCPPILVWIQGI